MWLDRNSSRLPTDCCPTSPLRSPVRVSTQPSLEIRAYSRSPDSSSRPAVIANVRPVSVHAVIRCTPLASHFLSLNPSWSFIMPRARIFRRSYGFTQFCTHFDVQNHFLQFLFLSVSVCFAHSALARCNRCPSSCRRVWDTWSVKYSSCETETGFIAICTMLR